MNHSQKLNSIKDEIKSLIKDKKGSSPLEIKESIKDTFDVSYRRIKKNCLACFQDHLRMI
jgi:hypothetical protein